MPFSRFKRGTGSLPFTLLLIVALAAQVGFGHRLENVKPPWDVLPPTPTSLALEASAFGDKELLYRILVLDLQNFGDTGGRITPLRNYDMPRVVEWLKAMDSLDLDANHHMKLAADYFAMTQDASQLDPPIRYMQEEVRLSPARHWQWLPGAVYLAAMRRKNLPWATEIAKQLSSYDFPDMPAIVRELGALLCTQSSDYVCARNIMAKILAAHRQDLPPAELSYIEKYIEAMNRIIAGQPPDQTPLPVPPPPAGE